MNLSLLDICSRFSRIRQSNWQTTVQPQQSHICQVWLWDGVLSGQRRLEIQAGVLSRHSWGIPGEDEVQAGLWGFNGKRAIETAWTSRAGAILVLVRSMLCFCVVFFSPFLLARKWRASCGLDDAGKQDSSHPQQMHSWER